jgi:hypothetical protein
MAWLSEEIYLFYSKIKFRHKMKTIIFGKEMSLKSRHWLFNEGKHRRCWVTFVRHKSIYIYDSFLSNAFICLFNCLFYINFEFVYIFATDDGHKMKSNYNWKMNLPCDQFAFVILTFDKVDGYARDILSTLLYYGRTNKAVFELCYKYISHDIQQNTSA